MPIALLLAIIQGVNALTPSLRELISSMMDGDEPTEEEKAKLLELVNAPYADYVPNIPLRVEDL